MVLIIWSLIVTYSRYYLGQHTIVQVVCGYIIGILYGIFWYFLTSKIFIKFYDFIIKIWPFNWFYFKNYSNISNRLKFEKYNCNKYKID